MLIGVTGTNGKSTTTAFATALAGRWARLAGWHDGLLVRPGRQAETATLPPGRFDPGVARLWLGLAADEGLIHEVFSLGLARGYYPEGAYDIAAFTGFDRDHLHYHGSLEVYWGAKRRLFQGGLSRVGIAVLQCRVPQLHALAEDLAADGVEVVRVGEPTDGGVWITSARATDAGTALTVEYGGTGLTGVLASDNPADLVNLEVALGIALALGVPAGEIAARLADLRPLPGRLERIGGPETRPPVYVDHAKTGLALRLALETLTARHGAADLVLSLGGDPGKAECLGAAATLARRIWVTDQTPERPDDCRAAVRRTLVAVCPGAVEIDGRPEAIARALATARDDGVALLVAGRGAFDFAVPGFPNRICDADLVRRALSALPPIPTQPRRSRCPDSTSPTSSKMPARRWRKASAS